MVSLITFIIGVFLITLVFVSLIVFFIWWIKLRKIKRNVPEVDVENREAIKSLNYDSQYIERRKNKDKNGTKEEKSIEKDKEEILRLEREILDTERELGIGRYKKGTTESPRDNRELPTGTSSDKTEVISDSSPSKTSKSGGKSKHGKRSSKSFRFEPI